MVEIVVVAVVVGVVVIINHSVGTERENDCTVGREIIGYHLEEGSIEIVGRNEVVVVLVGVIWLQQDKDKG